MSAEFSCAYRRESPPSSTAATPISDQQTSSTDSPAGDIYSVTGTPIFGTNPITPSEGAFLDQPLQSNEVNLLHLELFHHMTSVTCKEFQRDGVKNTQSFDAIINFALGAPFLMHEVLAISALHLSTLRTNQKEFYSNQAAQLQNEALSLFTNLPDNYTSEIPIPVFLFSSFLGIHVLFDTLLFRPLDFSRFMERFVGYLRLHRGVITIARGSWTLLRDTELGPLLSTGEKSNTAGNECAVLKSLMESADLSQNSIDICLKAIERLQWVFDSSHLQSGSTEKAGEADLIFAWPITISPEFTELLLQKKPEALAVLAHYAVLLHWRRDLWIINDGGIFLINSIVRHLGSYWEPWLALPISILQEMDSIT